MIWMKVTSTTWASLPIIISNERKNGGFCFCWLWQCCLCLSLLIFSHQAKILSIPSGFQVSASESPKLTSMIASICIYHRLNIDTSPHISGTLPMWCTSSSDLLRPKCIRGYQRNQWGEKSCLTRWMISSHISLWHAITRPLLLQLSTLCTKKFWMQTLLFFWWMGGVNVLTST